VAIYLPFDVPVQLLRRLKLTRRVQVAIITSLALISATAYGITHLSRFADSKLTSSSSTPGTMLYSAPIVVAKGDLFTTEEIASYLRAAGYSSDPLNPLGRYEFEPGAIAVRPGPGSYFRQEAARILFKGDAIHRIMQLETNSSAEDYALEPQPLVHVQDGSMLKQRPIQFRQIPKVVVNALLSAEDKHFFRHAGFDLRRILKAAWINAKRGRKEQGGSTITMQLARNLYLDPNKNWTRKVKELLLAEALEVKLTKEQIFERYVNLVYLGRRNTIELHGFGQAADTFFKKSVAELSLAEAALLAGLVQRPSYLDPARHPARAVARRNVVLSLMEQNGFITAEERARASSEPLALAPRSEHSDSPWFIDMALDDLQKHRSADARGLVITTLDPALQQDAVAAVRAGLKQLDARLARRKLDTVPEVALVALDPRNGEVKALIGGRNFATNQVNHALAMRQPASVFKPFVYAAALASDQETFTPATLVSDVPTLFRFRGEDYEPSNFGGEFYGDVTLRNALAKSINVAAVKVAEQVGYGKVLKIARDAGMNDALGASPSLALGAYEVTPVEMAGAYTVFANQGVYDQPTFVSEVRSDGRADYGAQPASRRVLDSTHAFLVHDMLSEVMLSGTAAGARYRGLMVPAAGKTGTSRDGWFAGYVSNLICVVWVGFDDNRDLELEGSKTALPIWTEFMKRASRRVSHRQPLSKPPAGVVALNIDSETGLLASDECQKVRVEYFIRGSEPDMICSHQFLPDVIDPSQTTLSTASLETPR
jgi:penicillin-binding protein 1B